VCRSTSATLGTVDRRIFGQFIEHIGRCIYGGVYDEGSPLADARGFRRDVLDAARPLRVPSCDGRRQLRQRLSLARRRRAAGQASAAQRAAWYAEESNRFGTDEFIEYCRVLGAEPFICVNMGSGTMDEPRRGSSTATAPATLVGESAPPARTRRALSRALLGTRQRDVRGWQIGNMNAHDYVKKAARSPWS